MANRTAFFEAIKAGERQVVKASLDEDPALIREWTDEGIPPVALATYYNEPEIAEMLVERGAEVDVFVAAMLGKIDRLGELLQADPSLAGAYSEDGWTALHLAAFFGHVEAVRMLIDAGSDVGAVSRNDQGNTALHASLPGAHLQIAEMLLAAGSDVNARQAHSFTPLHEAALIGDPAIARLLLDHGADAGATTDAGKTALELAEESSHAEVAGLLRQAR
jgi:ankyrin repeat protein